MVHALPILSVWSKTLFGRRDFFSFFVFVENRICEVVTAVNMRAIRKWTRDTISGVKCNDLIL